MKVIELTAERIDRAEHERRERLQRYQRWERRGSPVDRAVRGFTTALAIVACVAGFVLWFWSLPF